jgi:transcriptional regulator with XRE-family HTH domain
MNEIFAKYSRLISNELKELRAIEKLTQRQVAEKLGVSYQSYQAYERGLTLPTLENFVKLCQIFDTSPNDLLNFK